MPPENRGPMGCQKGSNKSSHPKASQKRHLSGENVHRSSSVTESKMHPITPQRQNKTPNKSGLTPVRPTKSPGPGGKLKSGLTPIKPSGQNNVPHKSPFQKDRIKQKSGLAPLRPGGFDPKPASSNDLDSSVMMGRRKSGLLPIRPGLGGFTVGAQGKERHLRDLEVSRDETITGDKPFRIPPKPTNNSELNNPNGFRRKSGLMPIKPPGGIAGNRDPQWKPRLSISNPSLPRSSQIFSISRLRPNIQASLKAISEDHESPTSLRSNMSGLAPLDDSEDMSVVIKHKKGQGSSRVPLPRASLSSSHFNASDNNSALCRIPKRVLHFDDEDLTVNNRNILKEGSSRMNTMQEKVKSPPPQNQPNVKTVDKQVTSEDKREALLKRKKEVEDAISKLSKELEEIKLELKLKENKVTPGAFDDSENCVTEAFENDSPFANVNSPASLDPLELLPLGKSKRPENMYKLFRQSCSFLKTPQPSAFNHRHPRREANITETPMNVSHRVQQQLADLFSDS